jgi:hypothetical protein
MIETLQEKRDRAERRREYLAAGSIALREHMRTGVAFAVEDVERYIVGIAQGKKTSRPRPAKPSKKS